MSALISDWWSASWIARAAFIAAVIAVVVSLLAGVLGFPVMGHDAYVHLPWLEQFTKLRAEGVIYPRWLPLSFGGYGAPTFYYYPPLPYFIASFYSSIGLATRPEALFHALQLTAGTLSVATVFPLLKRYSTSNLALWTGALLYGFGPYRVIDVLVRNALGEQWAFVWLPMIFLAAILESRGSRLEALVLAAIGWSGMFLTHIPTAVMSGLALCVFLIVRRDSFKTWLRCGVGLSIGLLTSAVFLLPAFAMRDLIQYDQYSSVYEGVARWGYTILDIWWRGLKTFVEINFVILIVGLCLLFSKRTKIDSAWKWIVALALFMQIPLISAPLYDYVAPIQIIQLSFRWNVLLVLAISVHIVSVEFKARNAGQMLAFGFGLLAIGVVAFESKHFFSERSLENSSRIDAPEYAPIWAPKDKEALVRFVKQSDAAKGLTWKGESAELKVVSTYDATSLPIFFWPYLEVSSGNRILSTSPDSLGRMSVHLSPGEHMLRLERKSSAMEMGGAVLSAFGIATILLLCAAGALIEFNTRKE